MDTQGSDRRELTETILDLFSAFCSAVFVNLRESWLPLDVTVPQIKALLIVASGPTTTSQIAHRLGVTLPSATRLVDRLVEHGLVTREENPNDRRYTNVLPTSTAIELVESLNAYRRDALNAALARLAPGELQEVKRGFVHLVAACAAGQGEADPLKESIRG